MLARLSHAVLLSLVPMQRAKHKGQLGTCGPTSSWVRLALVYCAIHHSIATDGYQRHVAGGIVDPRSRRQSGVHKTEHSPLQCSLLNKLSVSQDT